MDRETPHRGAATSADSDTSADTDRDRTLLDSIAPEVALVAHPDPPVLDLVRIAHRIADRLPLDIDARVETGTASVTLVGSDGTELDIEAYIDADERVWVSVTVDHLVHLDDSFLDQEIDELVNDLNITSPGCSWHPVSRSLHVCSGGTFPLEHYRDRLASLFADHFVTTAACAHRAAGTDHPSRTYGDAVNLLADESPSRYTVADVIDGVHWYVSGRAEPARRHVRVEVGPVGARISTPPYGGVSLVLYVQPVAPGVVDADWAASGLHVFGPLPGFFNPEDARSWCRRLNSVAFERTAAPMPWAIGNWRYTTGADGRSTVLYHGFVPNRYRPLISIAEVVEGSMRALRVGIEHHRLWTTLDDAPTADGIDVLRDRGRAVD